MNAFAQAFRDAGYKTPREKAINIAIDAWVKWPRESAGAARRDYVAQHFSAQPAWAWVTEFQPSIETQAIGALLNVARSLIRAQAAQSSTGRGHSTSDTERKAAPSQSKPKLAAVKPSGATDAGGNPAGGGHQYHETHPCYAPANPSQDRAQPETEASGGEPSSHLTKPITSTTVASNIKALADKHESATRASAIAWGKMSRLDTVKIGDKPIGDCTVGEVRLWAAKRQHDARAAGRDARFALILAANLSSEKIIRQYWQDPAEVDALYAKAEAEHAA